MDSVMPTLRRRLLLSDRRKTLLIVILVAMLSMIAALLATREPVLALLVALAVPGLITAMLWPDGVTLLLIFAIYTNAIVVATRFHNLPYTIGAVTPMILLLPLVRYLIIDRKTIVVNRVMILLMLFLGIQVISMVASADQSISLDAVIGFASEGVLLYFLIINAVRSSKTLKHATWALLLAGAVIGGLGLFQQVTGTFDNNYGGFAQAEGAGFGTGEETLQGEVRQIRLAGSIGEKNYHAQIMLMLVPIGLFRFWSERSRLLQVLALGMTGLISIGALLTFSRGLAVGFALLLVVMVVMRYIKVYQFAAIVVGVILLMIAMPQYGERLASMEELLGIINPDAAGVAGTDFAVQGRIGENLAAWLVFADHPVLGVGPGMFKYYYPRYAERVGMRVHAGTREAHNLYLDMAAETGGGGLLTFLAIVGVTLWELERARRRWLITRPDLANIATGFFLAIIGYLTTGIFLSMAYIRFFWVVMALAWVATSFREDGEEPARQPEAEPALLAKPG